MSPAVAARQKAWTAAKVYAAVKDLPEVIPLFVAVGAAVGLAAYTTNRVYFSTAGEAFPSKEMRGDMEKQINYGQESIPRSPMWHIAQWKKDSQGGADIAVWPFSNRVYPGEYEAPTHSAPHKSVQTASTSPTEY